MGSLFLSVWWLVWAFCDFLNLPLFILNAKLLPSGKQRKYRAFRGMILLLLACVGGFVFYVERIALIRYSFGQACLWFGIPYLILLVALLALQLAYRLPPFRKKNPENNND